MPSTAVTIREPGEARALIPRVKRFPKLASWLALQALQVPTLNGVVIWSANDESLVEAWNFANSLGVDSLLLRSDAGEEAWPYPRGGFLVSLVELGSVVAELIQKNRVVWLQEPVSPLADVYSLNGLAWRSNEALQVEIVGPGFDASDLKRGDITPHERFVLGRGGLEIEDHTIVSPELYRESWRLRVSKVGEMFAQSGRYQDPVMATRVSESLEEVEAQLEMRGGRLLLDAKGEYVPIAFRVVREFALVLNTIGEHLASLSLPGEPLALSMSLVRTDSQERVVFWDIVWPALKMPKLR